MLTAIIITHDEQENIADCVSGLSWCDEVLVVDDNSTDDTARIAKKSGARLLTHPLSDDFAAQRNWALDQATHDWVLYVDADERVSEKLKTEILDKVSAPSTAISAYMIKRQDHFFGSLLRHGDVGNARFIRLVKKNTGEWRGKVHERWISRGRVGELTNPLDHYPHRSIVEFLKAINYYSSIRAGELHSQGIKSNAFQIISYPLFKFLYLWVIRLGLLDGTAGTIHALMLSFHSFLVRAKLYLLWKGISGFTSH